MTTLRMSSRSPQLISTEGWKEMRLRFFLFSFPTGQNLPPLPNHTTSPATSAACTIAPPTTATATIDEDALLRHRDPE